MIKSFESFADHIKPDSLNKSVEIISDILSSEDIDFNIEVSSAAIKYITHYCPNIQDRILDIEIDNSNTEFFNKFNNDYLMDIVNKNKNSTNFNNNQEDIKNLMNSISKEDPILKRIYLLTEFTLVYYRSMIDKNSKRIYLGKNLIKSKDTQMRIEFDL